MDFLASLIRSKDTKSYLDIPDFNGPGNGDFPNKTGNSSLDFALFKISLFNSTESTEDIVNFIRNSEETLKELGSDGPSSLVPLLKLLLSHPTSTKQHLVYSLPGITCQLIQTQNLDIVKQEMLPIFKELLFNSESEVVSSASQAFVEAFKDVSDQECLEELVSLVIDLANSPQENITLEGIKILGNLAKSFGSEICKQFVVSVLQSFTEESSAKVKKELINSLCKVSEVIEPEVFKEKLLDLFLNHCKDTKWGIRKTCAENFPKILAVCDAETQKEKLIDVYLGFLKESSKWVKVAAKTNIGLVIVNYKAEVPQKLLKKYLACGVSGDIGYYAAYYFPGVLYTLGKDYWTQLKPLFDKLCLLNKKTQTCLASSLHEIAKILGHEITETELAVAFKNFLQTPSMPTHRYICDFLAQTQSDSLKDELLPFMKSMQQNISNWRVRQSLAEQLDKMHEVYSQDTLLNEIWQIGVALCEDRLHKVRFSAAPKLAKLACYLLKHFPESKYILDTLNRFSRNSNYQFRKVFLEMVKSMNETVFFEYFESEVQSLAEDKISNVRIGVAQVIKNFDLCEGKWKSIRLRMRFDMNQDVRCILEPSLNSGLTPPLFRVGHDPEALETLEFTCRSEEKLEFLDGCSEVLILNSYKQ